MEYGCLGLGGDDHLQSLLYALGIRVSYHRMLWKLLFFHGPFRNTELEVQSHLIGTCRGDLKLAHNLGFDMLSSV